MTLASIVRACNHAGMDVLVFDLDNTLLDRDLAIRAYLSQWAGGRSIDDLIAMDERGYSDRLEFCAVAVKRLGLSLSASEFWRDMQANLGTHCVPSPRRLDLLQRLRVRARVGLLTNGGALNQRAKIAHAGYDAAFDFIVVSGELGASKPDRRAFEACERWPASRYVMIGDHPEHDIAGAAACGWETIWVSNGRTWAGLGQPDLQIESVDAVESALQELLWTAGVST